jgi:hypothetical protein
MEVIMLTTDLIYLFRKSKKHRNNFTIKKMLKSQTIGDPF